MNAQDLRKLLEQTDDKLSIFANRETLTKYNLKAKELVDLIGDFLSDEEKLKLFDYSHFRQFGSWIIGSIINLASDENIILQMVDNDNIMNDLKGQQIADAIQKVSDEEKLKLLKNSPIIQKHQIPTYEIVSSLPDEMKTDILKDIDLTINKLKLINAQISKLIKGLLHEDFKRRIDSIIYIRKAPTDRHYKYT